MHNIELSMGTKILQISPQLSASAVSRTLHHINSVFRQKMIRREIIFFFIKKMSENKNINGLVIEMSTLSKKFYLSTKGQPKYYKCIEYNNI